MSKPTQPVSTGPAVAAGRDRLNRTPTSPGTVVINVESSTIIDRCVEDVYAFVSDQTNEPTWHTDVIKIRPAEASPTGLGSKWLVTVQFMGRREYEVEVTALDRDRRVEITTTSGWLRPTATYLMEPAQGGTRFTRHVDIPVDGARRVMRPLLQKQASKRNAGFCRNLKEIIEREP